MAGPPRSPPPTRRGSAPFSSGPRRWRPRRARARRRARRARGAPRRSPSLAGRSRRPHPRRLPPIRAAVSPAVFPAEAARLPGRPEHLRPPAVLEGAHVAPREDLERPLHFPGVIELRRVGFTESLEPGGVDEVAHGHAADGEFHLLDRVGGFVRVKHGAGARGDRKSTRLNSSHSQISYAVFCLKKKKKKTDGPTLWFGTKR